MAINFIRGFRRIGWVVTVLLAVFIILVFYENTKELSPANYEVKQVGDWFEETDLMSSPEMIETDMKDIGRGYFPRDVPPSIVNKIVAAFLTRGKPSSIKYHAIPRFDLRVARKAGLSDDEIIQHFTKQGYYGVEEALKLGYSKQEIINYLAERDMISQPLSWKFTVHKQVSKLKLAGLIVGAFACVALVIQGSISILAWVFKGFKGTTHIDVS